MNTAVFTWFVNGLSAATFIVIMKMILVGRIPILGDFIAAA